MAVKTQGFKDKIRVIITNKSQEIFQSYKKDYIKKLDNIGKLWNREITQALSVRHRVGQANTTLWPQLRRGKLRATVRTPKASVTGERKRGFYYEATIHMTRPYTKYKGNGMAWSGNVDPNMPRKSSFGGDVGEVLNAWPGKTFSGWKTRSLINFHLAIEQASYSRRLAGKTTKNPWQTKDFFTRSTVKRAETDKYTLG